MAYTLPANAAARRVMQLIGMRHDALADFDATEPDGSLSRCVPYRIGAP